MDIFSLLIGATIEDEAGNDLGEVLGFEYYGGKLTITTDISLEEDDPDPGEEMDDEDDEEYNEEEYELDPTKETGNVVPLAAVGGRR